MGLLRFVVAAEPGARCFADIVCDTPDLAEPKVGVQTDVRLAVACFSGTDSAVSVGLAAASCENLLCAGLTFVHYLRRQLWTVSVNGCF